MASISIAFVGQCHVKGYHGVPADRTFPEVLRRSVEARRNGSRVVVHPTEYQHPYELPAATERALRGDPGIVIIEVIGWLVVKGKQALDLSRLPERIRSPWERVRHYEWVRKLAGAQMPRMIGEVETIGTSRDSLSRPLFRSILRRYPRATVAEFEASLEAALSAIAAKGDVRAVVQGPIAPNLALNWRDTPPDVVGRYHEVEAMARRVADRHGALYVHRWDSLAGNFLPGMIRPTLEGHSILGHLLADELIGSGFV